MEKGKEIFPKISEIKNIINEKISSFEDYKLNKTIILNLIEQIETILNQIFNKKDSPNKEGINENNSKEISIKEESINDISENKNKEDIKDENNKDNEVIKDEEINNEEIMNNMENNEENIEENNEDNYNNQEEEESEKNSLPKLNFDYDKNINEILNNINSEQNGPFLKMSSEKEDNNDKIKEKEDIIKKEQEIPINNKEITKDETIKILNMQNNGYSSLFSFNQDLSNINNKSSFTTEDFTTKKNKFLNSNKNEEEHIENNIMNDNNSNINNNSLQSEENIYKNDYKNNMKYENNENNDNDNENLKNSKALRVADIIMKINSNDILYDIITQLYSKEILEQLMSPDVDINLINVIEQTIEKITILENEEIQKLRNKNDSLPSDINKNSEYNEIKDKDEYLYNELNKRNNHINNYNKLNAPKKINEYKKYKSSSSFYDKNKNSSINSVSSIYYSNYPPKKISSYKKNKTKAEMHLNSEILQNYPKTGKTILGYEKFKRDKNREFNFERSLRNENYDDNYNNINRRNYNLNISKADSIKNHSYYSINGNNRSYSNKRMIFNNYTSPFGDYFDGSLQKGGESKLFYQKRKRGIFKNARSPVKDYIDGLNDVYI